MYSIQIETGEVIRDSDNKVIAPCQSADDPDFVAYIQWVNQGNEPTVLPPIIVDIPVSVSPRQIRLALNQTGDRKAVEDAVANSSQDIKDSWEFATEIRKDDPMVQQMAQQLNLDIDKIFTIAIGL